MAFGIVFLSVMSEHTKSACFDLLSRTHVLQLSNRLDTRNGYTGKRTTNALIFNGNAIHLIAYISVLCAIAKNQKQG